MVGHGLKRLDNAYCSISLWSVFFVNGAGVAELVDARDLKSLGPQGPCRFDSGPPHQYFNHLQKTAMSLLISDEHDCGDFCDVNYGLVAWSAQ